MLLLLFPLVKLLHTSGFYAPLPNQDRHQEWSCHSRFYLLQCLPGFALAFLPWWSSWVLQAFMFFLPEGQLRNISFQAKVFGWKLGRVDFCPQKSTCQGVNSDMKHIFSSPLSVKTECVLWPHISTHIFKDFIIEGLLYCLLVEIFP